MEFRERVVESHYIFARRVIGKMFIRYDHGDNVRVVSIRTERQFSQDIWKGSNWIDAAGHDRVSRFDFITIYVRFIVLR